MRGIVSSNTLNVREAADKAGNKLGEITRGYVLDILGEENGWFKINYNGANAFVIKTYVDIEYAKVLTDKVSVLSAASKDAAALGEITKGSIVYPTATQEGWIQIGFNNAIGFLSDESVIMVDGNLAPKKQLKGANAEQNMVADIWNKYGLHFMRKSDALGIDIATAIAFLCVESGGKGFWKEGKCLIRFENHLFWDGWGKNNADTYNKFFKYGEGKERWNGHQYRKSETAEWVAQHKTGQEMEWDSFEFARTLNNEAAISSISMGAPQILGSNYKMLGYSNAQDMLDKFNADIRYHIIGFFDFCSANPKNIEFMKAKDFVNIAKFYNGPGQAEKYGAAIKKFHDVFIEIFK